MSELALLPSLSIQILLSLLLTSDSDRTSHIEAAYHDAHLGSIPHPGTVDLGTTSTDFLPAERERGITIQSASSELAASLHGYHEELVDHGLTSY